MCSLNPNSRAPTSKDSAFLETLIAQHQTSLIRYAARLLRDPDRARDVVQDTFVKLMAAPRESLDGHVVEWLFTVCRHRALDVLRQESRVRPLDPDNDNRAISAEPRPGRALEQAETQAAVLRSIEHLPANQQEVVRLKFQQGFSYKEIARITGLSVTNVGFLIHTAVSRLRVEFATRQSAGEFER
jgi:RNA polymerase sigma-70 factor (ECF subfamily)